MNDPLIDKLEQLIRECPLDAYAYVISMLLRQSGDEVKVDYATLGSIPTTSVKFSFRHEKDDRQLVIAQEL